jgi:ribosome-associated protein
LNTQTELVALTQTTENLNDLIIDSIQDIKGKKIVRIDLTKLQDAPADFFIICEGDSTTQVKAISDNIQKRTKETYQLAPYFVEGTQNARWICMDYFSTVVHIFHPESRSFYDLEELWHDGDFASFETL